MFREKLYKLFRVLAIRIWEIRLGIGEREKVIYVTFDEIFVKMQEKTVKKFAYSKNPPPNLQLRYYIFVFVAKCYRRSICKRIKISNYINKLNY